MYGDVKNGHNLIAGMRKLIGPAKLENFINVRLKIKASQYYIYVEIL